MLALANNLLHRCYKKIIHTEEMSLFIHKYVERNINVRGDCNCDVRDVSGLLGKGEDDYQFVCCHIIQEWRCIGSHT